MDEDDLQELWDEARSARLSDVCSLLDLELATGTWDDGFLFTFDHAERTPSLHVTDDLIWFDHSTGKGGDPVALVQAFFGCSALRAVLFITNGVDVAAVVDRPSAKREAHIPDLTGHLDALSWRANEEQIQFWTGRTVEKWGVPLFPYLRDRFGVTVVGEELWAPHRHLTPTAPPEMASTVCGIKSRLPDGRKLSVPGSKYPSLYRAGHWVAEGEWCYIVEGESDTWVARHWLDRHPILGAVSEVFGLPSGAGMWRDDWDLVVSRFATQFVVTDDDDAGNAAAVKLLDRLPNAVRIVPPGGRLAEAVLDGWKLPHERDK